MDTIDIVGIEKKLTKFYNEAIINPANGNAHIIFDNRLSIKLPLTLEKVYRNVVIKFEELNTINPFVYDELNNIFTCYYPKGKSYNTITLDSNMFQIEGMDYVKVGTIYTNTFKDKNPTRKIIPNEISITIDHKKQGEFLQENVPNPLVNNEIFDVNKWLQFPIPLRPTPELQYLMFGMGVLMYHIPTELFDIEEMANDPDAIESLGSIDPTEFYTSIIEVIDAIRYYEEVELESDSNNNKSIISIDIILYILIFIIVLIAVFYYRNKNEKYTVNL